MNEYNREQLLAVRMVRDYLATLFPRELSSLKRRTANYVAFRRHVDEFLQRRFSRICTRRCYQNYQSACCNREGITTFFADVVINALMSSESDIEELMRVLGVPGQGMKCVYLGKNGCLWRLKPIVCEMFLCDHARKRVFGKDPGASKEWERIRLRKKRYTWPTRPVLFDKLETYFMQKGFSCSLMYLHNSPGLLRVKALARKKKAARTTRP